MKGWDTPTGETRLDHWITWLANMFNSKKGVKLSCGHVIPDNTFPLERYNGCPFCGTPFETASTEYFGQASKLKMLELWQEKELNVFFGDLLESRTALDATQADSLKILLAELPLPAVGIKMKETLMLVIDTLVEQDRAQEAQIYFSAPVKPSTTKDVGKQWGGVGIGHLDTADPLNPEVQKWWMDKVNEIYSLIPDFGGFLVKANSEGMAGPQDYHRSHVDGANMLARALKPHGGIVLWRTFVYNPEIDKDRMKRSYKEFQPLDGQFDENVVLQTKNGTLDFQPSEPAQPLFGAMRHTPLFPELQITQEQ